MPTKPVNGAYNVAIFWCELLRTQGVCPGATEFGAYLVEEFERFQEKEHLRKLALQRNSNAFEGI